MAKPKFTVPGMTLKDGAAVATTLQMRLHALNDLQLTLKHAHWNVVGPHFIAVHEMLDPQIEDVRGFVDETAERIATLGVDVVGTPGALVAARSWDDYSIGRADAIAHLGALDQVYNGVIAEHRTAADEVEEADPVTNDMLIGHLRSMELFQWFIRAHLESTGGSLSDAGAGSERTAAAQAARSASTGSTQAKRAPAARARKS